MDILLSTVHGSHLYGTNRPGSDLDLYQVVRQGKTRQKFCGRVDLTVISLDNFISFVDRGVPQALEALWSPQARIKEDWVPFFASLRPPYYQTIKTFERVIRHFENSANQTRKDRVHVRRLEMELEDFKRFGHFNPTVSPERLTLLDQVV